MERYPVHPILSDGNSRPRSILATCFILLALVGVLILGEIGSPGAGKNRVSESYPWLYLRDDEPLTDSERVFEVLAVGDVMPGREVADEPRPFADVTPWLQGADLALGNLECVIMEHPAPRSLDKQSGETGILLHAPPSAVAKLDRAGFDVLGLANNHALDLGPAALAETISRLGEVGIAAVGVGPNQDAAFHPLIREVNGVRLALLAFNVVPNPAGAPDTGSMGWTLANWDLDRATEAVAAASRRADAVIASIHWGYEYQSRVDPAQRDITHVLLEAGADLVLGHHPHVVQGTELDLREPPQPPEVSRYRFVAYSLGNFLFDQQQGKTREGLALRAFFDDKGLRAVQAFPVRAGPNPRLLAPDEAALLLARVQPALPRLAFSCDRHACHTVEADQEERARSGLFWGGESDLTGDGLPERVRRVGEQVVIYQNNAEVWRSSEAWRVVDLALGDPNDDGRSELLLAFWRLDKSGVPRSHPFIVGYRGGIYRTVWGGSAVDEPIHEVELGDVDGDGVQELAVLEEHAVSVWRWHGWGFTLMWRSPPGRYRDLSVSKQGLMTVSSVAGP